VLLAQAWLLGGPARLPRGSPPPARDLYDAEPGPARHQLCQRPGSSLPAFGGRGFGSWPEVKCRSRCGVALTELYRHGCFLERNLSPYISPKAHLLGEAVALHALGVLTNSLWFRARAAGLFHFLQTTTAAACFIRMAVAYVLAPARRPPVECCSAAPMALRFHGRGLLSRLVSGGGCAPDAASRHSFSDPSCSPTPCCGLKLQNGRAWRH